MINLQKNEYIQIRKRITSNIYKIQYGDVFKVFENCLTSEKNAGYVCKIVIRSCESRCNDFIYLTKDEINEYSCKIYDSEYLINTARVNGYDIIQ
jgi:hypothetical protein